MAEGDGVGVECEVYLEGQLVRLSNKRNRKCNQELRLSLKGKVVLEREVRVQSQ